MIERPQMTYHKVMYKSHGLCAVFQVLVRLLFEGGLYAMSENLLERLIHLKRKRNIVIVTKLFVNKQWNDM